MDNVDRAQQAADMENLAARNAQIANRPTSTEQVALPFGRRVSATPYTSMKYRTKDAKWFLAQPEKLLKDPQPGFKYAWPEMDDKAGQTLAEVRAGNYIYVTLDELKPDCEAQIVTHKGPTGEKRVCWARHVLVKVPEKIWEEKYVAPAYEGVARLARHTQSFESDVARTGAEGTVSRITE